MKAIRKSDGKVIEVKEIYPMGDEYIPFVQYYETEDGTICQDTDLDFNVEESEQTESAVIQGWVARDEVGLLAVYKRKPERELNPYVDEPSVWDEEVITTLHEDLFPSLTWESEPLEVTITIKPKKKQ